MSQPSSIQKRPMSHPPTERHGVARAAQRPIAGPRELPMWMTLLGSGAFLSGLAVALGLTEAARQHTLRGWIERRRPAWSR